MAKLAGLILWILSFSFVATTADTAYGELTAMESIKIKAHDGVTLDANLYRPSSKRYGSARPAIIFANSWTMNKNVYHYQAVKLAREGYVVLSYSTRGFGRSGGIVGAGGSDDIKDVSTIIDWLELGGRVNLTKIGIAGVSYGGGIAALALAKEPRLSAAAMLSGWSDLYAAFFGNDTFHQLWNTIIVKSGHMTGKMSPEFDMVVHSLKTGTDLDWVKDWAKVRSPISYVSEINERGAPIFVSSNFNDDLFSPNQILPFFNQLTVPKRLILSPGIHASAEMPGLVALSDKVWEDMRQWFTYWLTDDERTQSLAAPYRIECNKRREYYHEFPLPVTRKGHISLKPANRLAGRGATRGHGEIEVSTSRDSGATTGIPVLSPLLAAHTPFKVKKLLALVNRKYAAIYYSDPLKESYRLRGMPEINLKVKTTGRNLQLVAYLYDVNILNVGTLISYGVITKRDIRGSDEIPIELSLALTAYDFKAGHKLALVIDGHDPLYQAPPNNASSFQVLHNSSQYTSLYLPLL